MTLTPFFPNKLSSKRSLTSKTTCPSPCISDNIKENECKRWIQTRFNPLFGNR